MSRGDADPADAPAGTALRRGWTTGACAAAAARAACTALLTGAFPDPVAVVLPRGRAPAFALARQAQGTGWACAGIVKDAGDDPDITHGATVVATARPGTPGSGIRLCAGPGVGTVRRAGLPVPVGEPAINPEPRGYIEQAAREAAAEQRAEADVELEIGIEDGERLAVQTLNPRLGIEGGLSVLGTSGVLVPFSCAAWIDAIQRGIDVARSAGLAHVAATTGRTSEWAAQACYGLSDAALIDMGDLAGGMLKYLRRHPLPYLTIAGGPGKLAKLAQGSLDLHSRHGEADRAELVQWAATLGADPGCQRRLAQANTVAEAIAEAEAAGLPLSTAVAEAAQDTALALLAPAEIHVEVRLYDRAGQLIGTSGWTPPVPRTDRADYGAAADRDAGLARGGRPSVPQGSPAPPETRQGEEAYAPGQARARSPILLLGGTSEALALARSLEQEPTVSAIYSIAGRTQSPRLPSLPIHCGGFGGAPGLADYLRRHAIRAVIDASHPFADGITHNAAEATRRLGIDLLVVRRPPWLPGPQEAWQHVPSTAAAVEALGTASQRVLLTIGSQGVPAFQAAPQHSYLIRCLEPPAALPPCAELLEQRGPFSYATEHKLLASRNIQTLVTKNAGGAPTRAKLDAAHALGVRIVMIDRPPLPRSVARATNAAEALAWLLRPGAALGVGD